MLAYSYKNYGTPDVLEKIEVPTPTPKPNEILIHIHAPLSVLVTGARAA